MNFQLLQSEILWISTNSSVAGQYEFGKKISQKTRFLVSVKERNTTRKKRLKTETYIRQLKK